MDPQTEENEKDSLQYMISYEIDKSIAISDSHISFVETHLPCEEASLIYVEKVSKNNAWYSEMKKRITASNFGRIMIIRQNRYPYN